MEKKHSPTLSLVYLPHLDYVLQKDGPDRSEVPHALVLAGVLVLALAGGDDGSSPFVYPLF